MQRAKPPQGESESLPPQMSAKSAQRQSGYYALCHQSQSGSLLMPIGPLCAAPEAVQKERARKQAEAVGSGARAVRCGNLLPMAQAMAGGAVACAFARRSRRAHRSAGAIRKPRRRHGSTQEAAP